jgi:type IV secretion system protein VirB9
MDARRLLRTGASALALLILPAGCSTVGALLPDRVEDPPADARVAPFDPKPEVMEPERPPIFSMAPIPNPPERSRAPGAAASASPAPAPASAAVAPVAARDDAAGAAEEVSPPAPGGRARGRATSSREPAAPVSGRAAIAEANANARAASRADGFENGVQVFRFEPGRLYEVWTAPFRVTTLTLSPGETVTSKAAGDTVRWQIGETTSGSGAGQRAHVLVKPLERGLETNLVLTTSSRVYMVLLRSAADDAFNAAVAWRYPEATPPPAPQPEPAAALPRARLDPGALDGRYRIEPRGRRPRWTPTAVFSDGERTVIAFPPDLQAAEAPVLFVLAPDGEAEIVNYRQQGGVFVVDRVFDRAELRLGERRPQVVRISRVAGRRAVR